MQSEEKVIRNIRNFTKLKKENDTTKEGIIRHISDTKVLVIEMKPNQLRNTLLKLKHAWKT